MPYILIQVTQEGVNSQQKAELIKRSTSMMVEVLNKDPATTFVIIEEVNTDNWGVAGQTVTSLRAQNKNQSQEIPS